LWLGGRGAPAVNAAGRGESPKAGGDLLGLRRIRSLRETTMRFGKVPVWAIMLAVATPAAADTPVSIGTVVSAETQVTGGQAGSQAAPLVEGSKVYSDDVIVTDLSGIGQIEFVDKTKLAVGPGSTLTLDRFIYDPKRNKTDIVIGFGQGTFRFITGVGTHRGYEITTPAATIGVRGTAFDVAIDADGEMAVAMIDGSVEVCSTRTRACRVHNAIGNFLHLTPDGVFTLRDKWDGTLMKGAQFAAAMPFLVDDRLLRPTFRAGTTVMRRYAGLARDAVGQAGQAAG